MWKLKPISLVNEKHMSFQSVGRLEFKKSLFEEILIMVIGFHIWEMRRFEAWFGGIQIIIGSCSLELTDLEIQTV